MTVDLPADVIEDAERLTRLVRKTPDENEAAAYEDRRDDLLATHEYRARIRNDDDGDAVLVLHPAEWHDSEAGVIRTDQIDDLSRAVEIQLEGTADPDDWETVDATNRELVEAVREEHDNVHGENARLLADFAGNHYAKPITSLTPAELAEFLSEYVVRNAWPTEAQTAVLEESLELVFDVADEPYPGIERETAQPALDDAVGEDSE
ncbi:uncharacterized protein Nmag_0310 [Natrialba magadii ATCC 43099]|uniref:RnhA operon protein n=1 Tax=Natrialba magadii (strain ATCC 43099 / DSM 3394 / CCM 3739 / CIP 104546 / IAM 13178 / JCM 8861 / NBRC 102185 / NCIMB 2190 / MS3) TaxID=547559 RepID=D3SX81_NATMM|nr:hypothetical protein [Natrialba magadii]ADD03901.1 uncharacterized protein Nmag_0310 [Natrialba magadii ATCC 43099]ELY33561.1 hypothetical protein C500_01975 [Natrialba magadii ATCC 43099]